METRNKAPQTDYISCGCLRNDRMHHLACAWSDIG